MKALLVDDHPLILLALQTVVQRLGPEMHLVCVQSAAAARAACAAEHGFDLVLLDLQLGDADGFDFLVELRASHPAMPVVVVSASDSNAHVMKAIYLGAMGFIPKRAHNDALLDALQLVLSGGIYVPPMAMRSPPPVRPLVSPGDDAGLRELFAEAQSAEAPKAPADFAAIGFTRRQTDVLALLLQGQSNKLIARALNLSVETIKDHVAAVLRTLNVNSRTQAVLAVSQMSNQGRLANWHKPAEGEARAA
jgi:DNA-binding NarL/FixJ family response regulator